MVKKAKWRKTIKNKYKDSGAVDNIIDNIEDAVGDAVDVLTSEATVNYVSGVISNLDGNIQNQITALEETVAQQAITISALQSTLFSLQNPP
jgi:hypothetical protein